uniref:Uncharacterized protein n=1 Tax=Romanomermis culicivorax TaxID=13658 RepID=A0A915JRX1_ROMCU
MIASYILFTLITSTLVRGQTFLPKGTLNPQGKIFADYVKPGPLAYSVRYNMDPTPNEVKFVDIKIDLMYVEILKASVNKAYCYLVFKTLGALLSQSYDISLFTFDPNGKASCDSLRRVENYLGSVFAKHKVQSDALTMVNNIVGPSIRAELAKGNKLIPTFFERLSLEIVSNFDFIVSVIVNTLISLDSSPGYLLIRGQQKAVNESSVPISINPLQYQMLMRTIYQQLAHIMYDALTDKFQPAMDVNKWPSTAKVADSVNGDVFAMLLSAIGNFMTDVQAQQKLQSSIVKSVSNKIAILIQIRNDVTGKERDYFTVQEWEELRQSVGLELASKQDIIDLVTQSFRSN